MADEGSENRAGGMDLNLYLGLPRSPRPRSLDLGSDLALSSLPLTSSSNSEESRAPEAASGAPMEASASNAPYSPSHTPIADADVLLDGFRAPSVVNTGHEYTPCFPSYEPYVTEGPSPPYSPFSAQALRVEQELAETELGGGVSPGAFEEGSPLNIDDDYAEGSGTHPPYSPTYLPGSVSLQEDERFASYASIPLQIGGSFSTQGDGSSSQQELLRSPEFRIRRLIESHQYRLRRFRSSFAYGDERSNFAALPSSPSQTELMQDIMNSQRSLETNGKHKVAAELVAAESSEEDTDQKSKTAANFECNICFDMSKEPVVTSCGHLFCWSCLYQWLHVHSDHKECPVCKGEVTESNIVPIYGRGNAGLDIEKCDTVNIGSDLKIPPRPRGNRLESWRQHLRPITRRFGEGITNSWRRLLNHQMRNRSRFGGHEDAIVQEMLGVGSHAVLTRSMARRLQREEVPAANLPTSEDVRLVRDSSSIPTLVFQEGNDIWQRLYGFPGSDRLGAVTADIGRAVGRFSSSSSRFVTSTSPVTVPHSDHLSSRRSVGVMAAADQASASSTVAVIQGESSTGGASAEPNSAGSSRPYRRRGRSNASGSSDIDGGSLHGRKRRRLN